MGAEWGQRAEEQPFFPVPPLAWNPGGNEALYWLTLVGGSLPTEQTAQHPLPRSPRPSLTQPRPMTGLGPGAGWAGRVKASSAEIRLMDEESEGQGLKPGTGKQGRGL